MVKKPKMCFGGFDFFRVLIQILCSYVTLPLYALVTQVINDHTLQIISISIEADVVFTSCILDVEN